MKKKILIFHHCGTLGGGSLSCFDLIDMLSKEYNIHLAIVNPTESVNCIIDDLDVSEKIVLNNYPSLTFHNANHSSFKSVLKYLASKQYASDWIKVAQRIMPDLIILNSSVLAPVVDLFKKNGFKTLCIVRETLYKKPELLVNRILRNQLSKASAVAFLTEYDLKTWAVNNSSNFVLPDVVNDRFYNYGVDKVHKNDDVFTFLYMGGIVLEKGIEILLDAYYCMPSDIKSRLVILGADPYKNTNSSFVWKLLHKKEISRISVVNSKLRSFKQQNKEIELVGVVTDTSDYYLNSDVVIFPVSEIHQPRPAYEAGFFKKPIILPDCPNFKENITDGVNGAYYKADDAGSLADKMYLFAKGEYSVSLIGEKNNLITKEKHSLENVMPIILHKVKEIIK